MFETLCTDTDTLPEWEYDRETEEPPAMPVMGMGVTIHAGSDCYPATVTVVDRKGRWFECQWDNTQHRPDGSFYYLRNTLSLHNRSFSRRKDGTWRERGGSRYASLGCREFYRDPDH